MCNEILGTLLTFDWESADESKLNSVVLSLPSTLMRIRCPWNKKKFYLEWTNQCPCCYNNKISEPNPIPVFGKVAFPKLRAYFDVPDLPDFTLDWIPNNNGARIDINQCSVISEINGELINRYITIFVHSVRPVITHEQSKAFYYCSGEEP